VTTRLVRPPDAQTLACPCRHGDVPAEMAGQRPLFERAAAGDREAFARLYDDQVEGVFRYLLAWTGDRSAARDMTAQVFKGAMAWLPVTAGGEGEAGAWLVAMARDAVLQARGSGWIPGPGDGQAAPRDVVGAVALLGDPEREVVVLRLLLGHSLAHTAHLSGYSRRAVTELQLAACLTISDLTSRVAPGGPGAAGPAEAPPAADEFERRLGRWEVDLTGGDARLADPLAVAASLRAAIPGYVVAPDDSFVHDLRQELVAGALGPAAGAATPDRPGPIDAPGGAGSALRSAVRAVANLRAGASRRPWVATGVAAAGIVVVLALQALGDPVPPSTCGGLPCPAPTTAGAGAAAGGSLGTPLSTVRQATTTTGSSLRGLVSRPPTPPAPGATTPPPTRPATTTPQTTRPRPTTTRAATTTATTTTSPATTTTTPTTTT
jgi:RNA polymerase sigma-70 factor, ECF subfamily